MSASTAVVVGGGIGGLCAAILTASAGIPVRLFEAAARLGGKAGTQSYQGISFDTGPSVLTLPEVFDEVFEAAGLKREECLSLTEPTPGFRYLYADGVQLDVFHELDETMASVESTLGPQARDELHAYLLVAERIWTAAAPHFVMKEAPRLTQLLAGGPSAWGAALRIDAFRSLQQAIDTQVRSEHLRQLLMRYATYNGSDVRRAPATLGCIAHVELALGGYGIKGGMYALVEALQAAALKLGVEIECNSRVQHISVSKGRVQGLRLEDGRELPASHIVVNADAGQLASSLLEAPSSRLKKTEERSMSAYTTVFQARRPSGENRRVAHTVLFPKNYHREFADIFDERKVPTEPTIYLCAQEACHGRPGWAEHEAVFCMINTPACSNQFAGDISPSTQLDLRQRLESAALINTADRLIWERTPRDLAQQFPGSQGALYGAASNSPLAAFSRPANRLTRPQGLYLASGSAHPGGGVPMVAQSGKQAARALIQHYK